MADKKITELPNINGADLVDADEFVVVDISADETKAITLAELKNAFDAGTGFVRVTGDTMTGALDVQSTITADGLTVNTGVNTSTRTFLVDNAHSGGSMYNSFGVYVGATDRLVTLSADYGESIMAFSTNGSERMRINSAGNVGIGCTPAHGIQTGNFRGTGSAPSFSGTSGDGFAFDYYNAGNPYPRHGSIAVIGSGTSTADLSFWTDSGSAVAERMRIDSSGNVGIGVNNPSDFDSGAYNLVVGSPSVSSQGITIVADTNSIMYFADGTSGTEAYMGSIIYNHLNNDMTFRTNGFNTALVIDENQTVTMPKQPAFLARPSGGSNAFPINAATKALFQTEIFDQNADYSSSTFTAPVTGKYYLSFGLYLNDVDTATAYMQAELHTSNRIFKEITDNDKAFVADAQYHWMGFSIITDMDAGDTSIIKIDVPNSGQAQMVMEGIQSFFSGYLVA